MRGRDDVSRDEMNRGGDKIGAFTLELDDCASGSGGEKRNDDEEAGDMRDDVDDEDGDNKDAADDGEKHVDEILLSFDGLLRMALKLSRCLSHASLFFRSSSN